MTEYASFSVWQDGVEVAAGNGPLPEILATAQHYAMMYGQDGPVRVIVRKIKQTPLGRPRL